MRVIAAAIVLGLLLIGATEADEQAEEQASKPLTPEQAADAVLEAFEAKDEAALKALASKGQPGPWLVTDELCFRGEHDAAEAFARAVRRKNSQQLPAYVASQRGRPANTKARDARASAVAARRALGDDAGIEAALIHVGYATELLGDHERALRFYETVLAMRRGMPDSAADAWLLEATGRVLQRVGRPAEALRRYEEALTVHRARNDQDAAARASEKVQTLQRILGR